MSTCDPYDLMDASTMDAVNDTLRLDYPASPFVSGGPYAVIETATPAVRQNALVPRGHGYATGGGSEVLTTQPYPCTGSGYTADRNGRLIPEWSIPSTPMAGGVDPLGAPVTTMKFRHGDGTPYVHTRTISNGQTIGASDWKLVADPASPTGFDWVPL